MTLRRAALAFSLTAFAAALPARAEGPNDILPEGPAKALVERACTACHQAPQVVARRRTAEEWDIMLDQMVGRGAQLTEAEQNQVYDYLVTNFGLEGAPSTAAAPAEPPKSR